MRRINASRRSLESLKGRPKGLSNPASTPHPSRKCLSHIAPLPVCFAVRPLRAAFVLWRVVGVATHAALGHFCNTLKPFAPSSIWLSDGGHTQSGSVGTSSADRAPFWGHTCREKRGPCRKKRRRCRFNRHRCREKRGARHLPTHPLSRKATTPPLQAACVSPKARAVAHKARRTPLFGAQPALSARSPPVRPHPASHRGAVSA